MRVFKSIFFKRNPAWLFAAACIGLAACTDTTGPDKPKPVVEIPHGFPPIETPGDNPITEAKFQLGRYLFYDTRLSADNSVSCASCHKQEAAFADAGKMVSRGVGNEAGFRNSPGLSNSAYVSPLFWDGRAHTIEAQALAAMMSPAEMYADTTAITARLKADENYQTRFKNVFKSEPNTGDAVKAIATFVRALVSGESRFDTFKKGNTSVFSESEKRGHDLFFSERTRCGSCHEGFNFTDNKFHSVGLHTHYADRGRYDVTKLGVDIGRFKTPSLRNVGLTAPYMNDGLLPTLESVVRHYNMGGKPFINKDTLIQPLNLTAQEQADLVAFLKTLTDENFVKNPRFKKP
ncbi:MAG TPA: cytochrome c peroxidase [Patescibacteria group bacterium]|nr:cytochrome c peroxidase [Patescibacteria group bacterium]